ncbi:MAG: ABC transporter permease [Candidatus Aenigmarchaeota archaeon]|nr:ABC transporter permease [Candidatus Aenigmarchaeota archaeon]
MADVYAIWLREMLRMVRARSRIIGGLAMPFFWFVFIGAGIGSAFSTPGMDYTAFLAPGILGMVTLFTSIFSGVSVMWDRQFGFLKEILVAPVSRTSIVIGKTLGGATTAVINGVIMLAISVALGAVQPGYGILVAVPLMFLIAVCFVSLGLAIASRMKSMEGFQLIMSFLVMPIFFLSGALFPLQSAPTWMKLLSYADPLTYGVDGLRNALLGSGMFPMWLDVSVLAGFTVALILAGAYLFRKSIE